MPAMTTLLHWQRAEKSEGWTFVRHGLSSCAGRKHSASEVVRYSGVGGHFWVPAVLFVLYWIIAIAGAMRPSICDHSWGEPETWYDSWIGSAGDYSPGAAVALTPPAQSAVEVTTYSERSIQRREFVSQVPRSGDVSTVGPSLAPP